MPCGVSAGWLALEMVANFGFGTPLVGLEGEVASFSPAPRQAMLRSKAGAGESHSRFLNGGRRAKEVVFPVERL
jgi:hypothetical protein